MTFFCFKSSPKDYKKFIFKRGKGLVFGGKWGGAGVGGGGGRERERNINVRGKHGSIASHMCPDQGSTLQPFWCTG